MKFFTNEIFTKIKFFTNENFSIVKKITNENLHLWNYDLFLRGFILRGLIDNYYQLKKIKKVFTNIFFPLYNINILINGKNTLKNF